MKTNLTNVIIEEFISKAQQKFFYSKVNDKTLTSKERKKWKRLASEFSKKTDFNKLPIKKELEEIVDEDGNIVRSKKPTDLNTKGITSNSTTDDVVKSASGQMGNYFSRGGTVHNKFWTESDLTKTLGFKDTMAKDIDYDDAEKHFKNNLDIDEPDEKLSQLGYDKTLPKDKINLIEILIDEILNENTK